MQLFHSTKGYAVGEAYELDGEIVPATTLEWYENIPKLQESLRAKLEATLGDAVEVDADDDDLLTFGG